ncbi:septation protein SepH [Naasia sp. SYSU D00057]|uniref:septation protein SepH n=1 Tax=Naasia sp. SYSU D00057 TaxID=2817380 RepID=UPI001B3166D1|nr:septation protein SepH [Naasia sp. SYSU D00057]
MKTLKAVAVENGAIVATGEDGNEFRIHLDDELRAKLRGTPTSSIPTTRRSSPREIQTYIRGGMSAEQVAKFTGAPIDYIERYEGPILAERQYMVESALGVPVLTGQPADDVDGQPPTFGTVLEERLAQLNASGSRWASWKEPEGGWIVKLNFTADGIDHDARWSFDAKKLHLAPLNGEAVALSQQNEIGTSLLPRLRAVAPESPDTSRFDSGAFELPPEDVGMPDPVVHVEQTPTGRIRVQAPRTGTIGVIREEPPAAPTPADTSDLLEALRRRRGEREAATYEEEPPRTPTTGTVRVLERVRTEQRSEQRPENRAEQVETTEVRPVKPQTGPVPTRGRRGRTSMPSWDEIVFGARPEDDSNPA